MIAGSKPSDRALVYQKAIGVYQIAIPLWQIALFNAMVIQSACQHVIVTLPTVLICVHVISNARKDVHAHFPVNIALASQEFIF